MAYFAGIDWSMNSPGICVYDNTKELCFENCFFFVYTKNKQQKRNKNIFFMNHIPYNSEYERFDNISEWAMAIIKKFKIYEVGIEGYSFGSKSSSLFNIAENCGVLKHKLWKNQTNIKQYAPSEIKKFFSGKGNANKEYMFNTLLTNESIDLIDMLGIKTYESPVSDIVDSYAILKLLMRDIYEK